MNRNFLNKYRRLEQFIRRSEGKDNQSISQIINEGRHPFIIDNREVLDSLNRIRNVFAHNETINYLSVNEKAIELMDSLLKDLPDEETANEIMTRNVVGFQINDPLSKPLKSIATDNLHQFPIYQGKEVRGLLTDNGITNWLAKNIHSESVSIKDTTIEEVLENDDLSQNYRYVAKDTPYGDIIDIYKSDLNLRIILVTETGKKHQAVLGIITPWDLLF